MSPLARQQQALLQALWAQPGQPAPLAALPGMPTPVTPSSQRGLAAYRTNAGALAERALQAAYPVVAALIGAENFAPMAREFWHRCPPERGDLAWWGACLPDFVAQNAQLADVPYLADVARVEWALHRAATAPDACLQSASFGLLAQHEPDTLRLLVPAGTLLYRAGWPVVSLISAHLHHKPDLERVAGLVQARQPETALVWRQGLRPRLAACTDAEAALLASVLAGHSMLDALDAALQADAQFDFSGWLNAAVTQGQVLGAELLLA